ncbi:ylyB, partial [Symbiodinium sp. CCMP2456]
PTATKLANEHPEWAERCSVQPARPGEPCSLTIFMAEVGLDDALLVRWCSWMDRRLTAERPNFAGGSQFKASTIDFSENTISVKGMKALCDLLEKHRVRCE